MIYTIPFKGHHNIQATHRTTTEITVDSSLSVQGDCIVGVSAGCGCAGLPDDLKTALRNPATRVRVAISVGENEFVITGRGDPNIDLKHPADIVIRKSRFTCPRTLAVGCDVASIDMPRRMVRDLRAGHSGTLSVTTQ